MAEDPNITLKIVTNDFTIDPYDFEKKQLQNILDQMNAMQPLAEAGATCTDEEHEAWMKQANEIDKLTEYAKFIALLALPPEVKVLYEAVHQKSCFLYNIDPLTAQFIK